MRYSSDRYVGVLMHNNEGLEFKILNVLPKRMATVRFTSTGFERISHLSNIIAGKVFDPYNPIVYGVGFMGDCYYNNTSSLFRKSAKSRWNKMMARCYSGRPEYSSYVGCEVCEEWHNFSNYLKWYELNSIKVEGVKIEIDKDLLGDGKLYSPETCCFLPCIINNSIKADDRSNKYRVGVVIRENNKFGARIHSKGRMIRLGSYNTVDEAHDAYVKGKTAHIKDLADKYRHCLSDKAYTALINFKYNYGTKKTYNPKRGSRYYSEAKKED